MNDRIVMGERNDGGELALDLGRLMKTRLLIQAMSGAGKSWLIRRLLEATHGKVQQIVLDLEGEFPTLREVFPDYVIAGHGGDIACTPRSAPMLARKVNELGVSLIADLSELEYHERVLFVRRFLETLIGLPRAAWRPALVVLDEAHHFAPEKGQAESARAVIDLSTRGRKRGLCAVLATQRLAKLHKDATAEITNKLIGRTVQDIDRKRAADELGIRSWEEVLALRDLGDGEFWAFGPAFLTAGEGGDVPLRGIIHGQIGAIRSRHPAAGAEALVAPSAPTAAMRRVLAKLGDLPAEAEREIKDLADAKVEVARLSRELKAAKRAAPAAEPAAKAAKAEPCTHPAEIRELRKNVRQALERADWAIAERGTVAEALERANAQLQALPEALTAHLDAMRATVRTLAPIAAPRGRAERPAPAEAFEDAKLRDAHGVVASVKVSRPVPKPSENGAAPTGDVTGPQQRLLDAMGTLEAFGFDELAISQVAAFAKRRVTTRLQSYISDLAGTGHLERVKPGYVRLLDAGRAAARAEALDGADQLRERWLEALGGPQRAILSALIEAYPDEAAIPELARGLDRLPTTRFQSYISELCTRGAATRPRPGFARCADALFPEGA